MSGQTSLEDLLAPQSRDKPNADAHKIDATPRQAVADTPAEPEAADAKEPATSKGEKPPADAAKSAEGDDVPPASSQDKDQRNVPVKALEDERRKRQEAEKARKELEARIADLEKSLTPQTQPQAAQHQGQQPQQQQQQPQNGAPDPWTDPEGYAAFQREMQEQMMFETRVVLGQDMMRVANPDYDEIEEVFTAEAQQNPYLIHQLRMAPNPAKFAYEQGKRLKLLREIGTDPDAYRKKVEEEVRAQLAASSAPASAEPAQSIPAKKAPPPPTSLAGVPSAAPRDSSRVKWDGPTPLDDILR